MTKSEIKETVKAVNFTLLEKEQNKILKKTRKNFRKWANELISFKNGEEAFETIPDFSFRVTALPLKKLENPKRIFENNQENFFRSCHYISLGEQKLEISIPIHSNMPKPILRGVEYINYDPPLLLSLKIREEGLIEILWRKFPTSNPKERTAQDKRIKIYEAWPLSLFVSALEEIEKFNEFNGLKNNPFLLEMEIISSENHFYFYPSLSKNFYYDSFRVFSKWKSPFYLIGSANEKNKNLEKFHRDIYDSSGLINKPNISI